MPAPRPEFRADRYTSADFLQQEVDRVFHRTWLSVARDSDLPEIGDRLPLDELGKSLILLRGPDGAVRAFHNACRHRGTRLVSRPCQAKEITCPYHGWTYDLDGRLARVPGSGGFTGLDVTAHGLRAVRAESWGGFVWITFNPDAPPLRAYLGGLGEQLDGYRLSDMRPLMRRSWTLPCNWKAVLDQATEAYHLRSVHGSSMAPHIPVAAKFHGLDPHHLQTVPIVDYWWRTRLDRLSSPSDIAFTPDQLRLFHKCVIFPNTLLNVMPYHLTVFRVYPLTADTCSFQYEFHLRERAGAVARARGWLTLAASLYVLREDFGLLAPFQTGVKAAGAQDIPFHRDEHAVAYFHGIIDRYLAGEPATNRADSVVNAAARFPSAASR